MNLKLFRDFNGWTFKNGGKSYGPLIYLPRDSVDNSNLNEIYNALNLISEEDKRRLNNLLFKTRLTSRSYVELEPAEFQSNPTEYFDGGTFVPKKLGDVIKNHYHFKTLLDSKEIYVYRDGIYINEGETVIEKCCNCLLGNEFRKSRASEVANYIQTGTYVNRMEEPLFLIPLENGVLNLQSMILEEYNPNFMFFQKIPVIYDSKAKCPQIMNFLREITSSSEDVTIIEEVIGYCLYREYPIHKALMLVGDGANGKSTLLSLIREFLGRNNVSGRNLQDIVYNRFALADLFGKLANIYADLPDKALRQTGPFKMLTGGDAITAEKKFRDSFDFVNYAKLMFSANKVPESFDDTDAFFRRWIILVFPNKFEGEECDPNILEKLTSPEELSGLLNLALSGLIRVLENGQFSHSKTTDEIREDYIRKSSPIGAFVLDCIEVDSDAFIVKQELYNTFTEYCRMQNLPAVSRETFFKNLPQHVSVNDYRPKIKGKRVTAVQGIRFTNSGSGLSRVLHTLNKLSTYNS